MSKGARGQIIELGGEPRINFLPPEIQQRKDARRRRRSLFMLVILVAVLCGIGYFYSAQYATERQAALEAEQQTTLTLLAEQGQYTEASKLSGLVSVTDSAIVLMSSTEVFWKQYVTMLDDALPAGITPSQWTLRVPSALETPAPPSGLFPIDSIGKVEISVTADSLASINRMMDALANVVGVAAVTVNSAVLDDAGYQATAVLDVTSEIYELRFADGWDPSYLPVEEPAKPEAPVDDDADGDEATENGEE